MGDCDWVSDTLPIDFEFVQDLLLKLDAHKSLESNGIHSGELKKLADVIARHVSAVY